MTQSAGLPLNRESSFSNELMQAVRRIERKLGRAVLWEPTHDAYFRLAGMLRTSQVPPLYIAQAALRTVDARLREGDVPLPFGLLVGNLYVDSRAEREYLLIDEVVSAHIEPFAESLIVALMHELRALAALAEQRGRQAIGWFVGEELILERMAREDVELHRAMFPEPWQVMFVRDLVGGRNRAAFIRIEPSDQRPYAIPFFELLPDSVLAGHRSAETVVRWQNYKTRYQVVLADETDRERVALLPKSGMLRRLGDLRKRVVTPRRTATPPNGNLHDSPVTERGPDTDNVRGRLPATEEQRAPIVSPTSTPVVPVGFPIPVAQTEVPVEPRDIRPAPPVAEATSRPPHALARPPESSDTTGPVTAPRRESPVAHVGTSIEVRPITARLPQHGTLQLQARLLGVTGAPVSGATITYSSSHPSVVEVSVTGLVTSVGPAGPSSIRVESGNLSVIVQVMVTQVASRIEVWPNPTTLTAPRRRRLTARVFDAIGAEMKEPTVDFTSSDPATVAVSSEGVLTPVAPSGQATITVRAGGTALSEQVRVTIVRPTRDNSL